MQALLLDIEGTTTPVDFVYQVLFPYARTQVRHFLQQHYHTPAVSADIEKLRKDHRSDEQRKLNPPIWEEDSMESQLDCITAYVQIGRAHV